MQLYACMRISMQILLCLAVLFAGSSGSSLPSTGIFRLFEPAVLQWIMAHTAAASSTTSLLLDVGPTGSFDIEQLATMLQQLQRVCLIGDLNSSRAYGMLSELVCPYLKQSCSMMHSQNTLMQRLARFAGLTACRAVQNILYTDEGYVARLELHVHDHPCVSPGCCKINCRTLVLTQRHSSAHANDAAVEVTGFCAPFALLILAIHRQPLQLAGAGAAAIISRGLGDTAAAAPHRPQLPDSAQQLLQCHGCQGRY